MWETSKADQEGRTWPGVFLFCVVWLKKGSMIFEQKRLQGIEI